MMYFYSLLGFWIYPEHIHEVCLKYWPPTQLHSNYQVGGPTGDPVLYPATIKIRCAGEDPNDN